jgi:DNA-binding NarL/FixJ family response regulator
VSDPFAEFYQGPHWARAISVVLVDDSPLAMTALVRWLRKHLPLHVVGEAEDGLKGLDLICRLQPDLVITDLQMPGLDGLELVERLRLNYSHMRLIVASSDESPAMVEASLRFGANAFIAKNRLPVELAATVARLFPQVAEAATPCNAEAF